MKNKLSLKVTAIFSSIVLITCLVMLGTSAWINTDIEKTVKEIRHDDILDGYKTEVKSEVQSALTTVQYYYDLSKSGKITEDVAKEQAKEAVRSIRYGDESDGYIWIDSTDYTLVMHPILPDQEGTNRKNLEDCNGVMIIQEIMKTAQNKDGGFNEFVFTKSDGKTEAPKVAYSKAFEPWNWVLTSGCYTDDINGIIEKGEGNAKITRIFNGSTLFMIAESIVIIVLMVIVSVLVIRKVVKSIDKVKKSLEEVSNGNLTETIDTYGKQDELSQMIGYTNNAIKKFNDIIKNSLETSLDVESTGSKIDSVVKSTVDASKQIALAIEGVASDATNQAAAITEVTNAVQDMKDNTENISKSVKTIDESAEELSKNSEEMKNHIITMQDSSKDMTVQVTNIADKIKETNDTIEKMSTIINSIEEIASQTNLLALNASIEAARAGEAGRGFAVVADSIKSLSESTSDELGNIKEIITSLIDKFTECTSCIGKVVESNDSNTENIDVVMKAFETLDKGISNTSDIANEINTVIGKSVYEIESINSQIEEIQRGAESSAAASEEVTASSEELTSLMTGVGSDMKLLNSKAQALVEKLNKFKVN